MLCWHLEVFNRKKRCCPNKKKALSFLKKESHLSVGKSKKFGLFKIQNDKWLSFFSLLLLFFFAFFFLSFFFLLSSLSSCLLLLPPFYYNPPSMLFNSLFLPASSSPLPRGERGGGTGTRSVSESLPDRFFLVLSGDIALLDIFEEPDLWKAEERKGGRNPRSFFFFLSWVGGGVSLCCVLCDV